MTVKAEGVNLKLSASEERHVSGGSSSRWQRRTGPYSRAG